MSDQEWAKEPLTHDGVWFKDGDGRQLGGQNAWDIDEATRNRMLACVNACAGVPTEELRRMKGIYNTAIQGIELVGAGKAAFAFVINHDTGRYYRYKVTIEGSCLREINPKAPPNGD